MMASYYIAACLFTARFPEVSLAIQRYIHERGDIRMVRCCIPNYSVKSNAERIPAATTRDAWKQLAPWTTFEHGDVVYSLCHNCTNIVDEQNEGVQVRSLWELLDEDETFVFPDYSGLKVTLQDCWRTRERSDEQSAVRSILKKMNIDFIEAREHHEQTDFCGSTLYREQRIQNAQLAPKHYVEQAAGKFLPHSQEEQLALMRDYCSQFTTKTVVCYCHYCLEGLLQGGVDGRHLAHMIFAAHKSASSNA